MAPTATTVSPLPPPISLPQLQVQEAMSVHLGAAIHPRGISPPPTSMPMLAAPIPMKKHRHPNAVLLSENSESDENDPLPGGHTTPPPPPSTDSEEELKLLHRPASQQQLDQHQQQQLMQAIAPVAMSFQHQLPNVAPVISEVMPEIAALPVVSAEDVVDSLLLPGGSFDMPSLMDLSPTIAKHIQEQHKDLQLSSEHVQLSSEHLQLPSKEQEQQPQVELVPEIHPVEQPKILELSKTFEVEQLEKPQQVQTESAEKSAEEPEPEVVPPQVVERPAETKASAAIEESIIPLEKSAIEKTPEIISEVKTIEKVEIAPVQVKIAEKKEEVKVVVQAPAPLPEPVREIEPEIDPDLILGKMTDNDLDLLVQSAAASAALATQTSKELAKMKAQIKTPVRGHMSAFSVRDILLGKRMAELNRPRYVAAATVTKPVEVPAKQIVQEEEEEPKPESPIPPAETSENQTDPESDERPEGKKSPRSLRGRPKDVSSEVASLRDALSTEDPIGKRRTRKTDFSIDEFSLPRVVRKKKVEESSAKTETSEDDPTENKDQDAPKIAGRKTVKGRGRPTKFGGKKGRGKKKRKNSTLRSDSDGSDDDDDEEIPPGVDPLKRNPEKTKTKILGSIFAMKRPQKPDESRIREGTVVVVVKEAKEASDEQREAKPEPTLFKSPPVRKGRAKKPTTTSDSSDVETPTNKADLSDSETSTKEETDKTMSELSSPEEPKVNAKGRKKIPQKSETLKKLGRRPKLSESSSANETSETDPSPVRRGRSSVKSESEKSEGISEEDPSPRPSRTRRQTSEETKPVDLPHEDEAKPLEEPKEDDPLVKKSGRRKEINLFANPQPSVSSEEAAAEPEVDKKEEIDSPVRRTRRHVSNDDLLVSPPVEKPAKLKKKEPENVPPKTDEDDNSKVEISDEIASVSNVRNRRRGAASAIAKVESESRTRTGRRKAKDPSEELAEDDSCKVEASPPRTTRKVAAAEAQAVADTVTAESKSESTETVVIPLVRGSRRMKETPKVEDSENVVQDVAKDETLDQPINLSRPKPDLSSTSSEPEFSSPVRRGRRKDAQSSEPPENVSKKEDLYPGLNETIPIIETETKIEPIRQNRRKRQQSSSQQSSEQQTTPEVEVRVESLESKEDQPLQTRVKLPQLSPQDEAKLKPAASSVVLQQLSPKQLSPRQQSPRRNSSHKTPVENVDPPKVESKDEIPEESIKVSYESVPLKKRGRRVARKSESEQSSDLVNQRPEKLDAEMSPNSRRGRSAAVAEPVQPPAEEVSVAEEPKPIFCFNQGNPADGSSKLSTGFQIENILRPDVVEVRPSAPEVSRQRNRRKGNPKKIVEVQFDDVGDLSDLDDAQSKAKIGKSLFLNFMKITYL